MRGARNAGIPLPVLPSLHTARHRHLFLSTIRAQRHLGSDRYQKNATKYWDNFYKRHDNKFFKDRHYLEKDWGCYFSTDCSSPKAKVVLEVGCGAGNTIFPLITAFPNLFVHACDFSPHAIRLVKSHGVFREDRVNAFVYDVTNGDLCEKIIPSSVDVVTLFLRRTCPLYCRTSRKYLSQKVVFFSEIMPSGTLLKRSLQIEIR